MTVQVLPTLGCVFCEDIRHEVGGLASFIGVMPPAINLPSFPCIMPKFGISVSCFFEKDKIPDAASIRVVVPWQNDPLVTQELDMGKLKYQSDNEADPESIGVWSSCRIVLSPLEILSTGRLRAEVNAGSGWQIAGMLRFREMPALQETSP